MVRCVMEMNYDNYSIHVLRNIARGKGVKSPTTKRKSELISEIELIEMGLQKPYVTSNKQGRPAKYENLTYLMMEREINFKLKNKTRKFRKTNPIFYGKTRDVKDDNMEFLKTLSEVFSSLGKLSNDIQNIINHIVRNL